MPRLSSVSLQRAAHRMIPSMSWVIVFAALAWLLGNTVVQLSAPAQLPYAPTTEPLTPAVASQRIAEQELFGTRSSDSGALSNLHLIGVVTGPKGFALIQDSGKAVQAYIPGEEIVPGVRLVKLSADSVEVLNGQQRQQLELARTERSVEQGPSL